MNSILIKGKLTTGAPALTDLAIREMCYVIPDATLYIKKDALTILCIGGVGLLNNPSLTGTATAPTPSGADNSTKIATTAFVQALIGALGVGDMLKSVYDTTNNGNVDTADNALLLGGSPKSYFTNYTDTAIANLVASSPAALDTLNELATALGNDPAFASTMTALIATKLNSSSTIDGGTF